MKKLISLVLVLVLVFALAVPSFAVGDNSTELDALNNIDYYVYWIFQDFTEKLEDLKTWNYQSMMQLLDINDFTRSIYSELDSLNSNLFGDSTYIEPLALTISNSLSSLEDSFNFFNDSFFDNVLWGEPFAEVVQDNLTAMAADLESSYQLQQYLLSDRWDFIEGTWWKSMYDDLHQLKEVLADDEDLIYKESQKANQESAFNSFFSSSSGTSLSPSSFTDLSSGFDAFSFYLQGYEEDSSVYLTSAFSNGLAILRGEDPIDSGFSSLGWFSEATAADIDLVSSFYSFRDDSESVTDYYSQQQDLYFSFFGRGD